MVMANRHGRDVLTEEAERLARAVNAEPWAPLPGMVWRVCRPAMATLEPEVLAALVTHGWLASGPDRGRRLSHVI
jgi:hypothetical protein